MKQNKMLQSGRSMVEMLGTLAIIGVLSIGGIAGYSYGMDKYRANQTMQEINLRVIDLIAQVERGGGLSLSEWPVKTASNYDIGLEMESGEATGGIFVKGVKQQVCEILSESLIQTATIKIGTTEYTDSTNIVCGKENDMVFYYDDIFNADENACQDMENGVCFDEREYMACSYGVDENNSYRPMGCPNLECWQCYNDRCVMMGDGIICTFGSNSWGGGYCYQGECIPENKKRTCTKHSQCEDNEFCNKGSGLGGIDVFDQTIEGSCYPLYIHKEYLTLSNGASKTIYVSDARVADISVVDLCDRIGKKMLTYDDLYYSAGATGCPVNIPEDDGATPTPFREALIAAGHKSIVIERSIWDSDACKQWYEATGREWGIWRTDLAGTHYAPGEAMEGAICQ